MKAKWMTATIAALILGPSAAETAVAQENAADAEVTVQRVWSGTKPSFSVAHPSPDGRYVTSSDTDSGDLGLIDLVSKDRRRMGVKDGGREMGSWAEYSVFSPDGETIAFVWFTASGGLSGEDGKYLGYSIKTIPVTGGEPLDLVPAGAFHYAVLDDWSADGEYLLARLWKPEGEFCLCRIRTSDGSITAIPGTSELGEGVFSQRNAFSPDGNHVAFDTPGTSDDRDVYLVDVATGDSRLVLEGIADDRLLGWLPDGSGLLFRSDRGATSGIWMLPLGPDLRVGEPRLLRSDVWRAQPLGFSRDAFYYGVTVESQQVYVGAIDARNGGYLAPAGPVQEATEGNSFHGEFSPDGRYVTYARMRGPGKHEIVVRAVGGDDVRIFKSDKQRSPIGWTPDSRAVFLNAQLDEREFGAVRLDLATGESTVLNIARNPGRSGLVSADGKEVYTISRTEADGTGIFAFGLNDGSERLIAAIESPGSLSLSPDGQTFAVLDRSTARIYTLPIAGGDPNVIFEIEGDITQSGLSAGTMAGRPEWTPDGKHILFIQDGSIMRVPVSGGLAEKVVDIPEGRRIHFRLHPDGSRFLINAGLDKGEIWMVKGLPGMPVGSGTSDR